MSHKRSNALELVMVVFCLCLITVSNAGGRDLDDEIVTTKHQVTVAGRVLKYTARAGRLPILDNQTGEVHANMFFIAYTLDTLPNVRPRPLTFLWNGGPGS